jgi:SEC-C motif-containing protein/antitoxin Xre/MbcA/ParS-like protein
LGEVCQHSLACSGHGHIGTEELEIMDKIGRNDPCPCGSGKKYKKCCLMKEEEVSARQREEGTAVSLALDWLAKHHPEQIAEAIDANFYGALEDDELDRLNELSPHFQQMAYINSSEWLINDARFEVKGKVTPVRELLLGPGGPLLPSASRNWLQRLGERPLSLYEVREVKPGEGLVLIDLLRPEELPVRVAERSASRTLVRYDILGTRLVRRDGGFVLSGAVYPFARDEGIACQDEILGEMKKKGWKDEDFREFVAAIMISRWLYALVVKRPLPALVDTSTGEPIMLTTDHYRVNDWQALENVLALQSDVEGDRTEGWVRFTPIDGEMRRSRAALNPQGADGLVVFCRTVKLADEARKWLERVAAGILTYRIREMVDPRSEKARESTPAAPATDIPPEITTQLVHNYMANFYANWTEEPIPALGNKTPRAALGTEQGRRKVIDLLKSYEHGEAQRVRDQGGEPFDFGFLWESLELKRE